MYTAYSKWSVTCTMHDESALWFVGFRLTLFAELKTKQKYNKKVKALFKTLINSLEMLDCCWKKQCLIQ